MIIHLLYKSYFHLILTIGFCALAILLMGFYFIVKKSIKRSKPKTAALKSTAIIHYPQEKPVAKPANKSGNKEDAIPIFVEEEPTLIESFATDETDVKKIAGESVIATQLDLARAYIETGNRLLAEKILTDVVSEGNSVERDEARILLGLI